MPNLVILFGPPAAGKASIGHELSLLTGYRFFHNHLTADPVAALFGWGNAKFCHLMAQVRDLLLKTAAEDAEIPGVIFTTVWDLGDAQESASLQSLAESFIAHGGQVYFVELQAALTSRIAREGTPFRLALKPALRDVEIARERQVVMAAQFQMNTTTGLPLPFPHLIIDTDALAVLEAASKIQHEFNLPDDRADQV